jgi:RNA polymerase sigma-B factor
MECYMPLARSLARRYRHTSEDFDDLLQVAALGLLKAIDRYDPSRGTEFSSLAVPTILGELRRHLRDHSWPIRVPRDLQELALRVGPAAERLAGKLGRDPTPAQLAADLEVSIEQVMEAHEVRRAHSPTSLDLPTTDANGAVPIAELVPSDEDPAALAENRVLAQHFLDQLTERNQEVLRLHFEEDLTQVDIGRRVGCSQMHVSRVIRRSLEHLQVLATSASTPSSRPDRPTTV